MKRHVLVATAIALFFLPVAALSAQKVDRAWFGRWEGVLQIGERDKWTDNTIAFRFFERGAVIDLPNSRLYGYPAKAVSSDPRNLALSMRLGDKDAVFTLFRTSTGADGVFQVGTTAVRLTIVFSSIQPDPARSVSFPTARGPMAGSLELPASFSGKIPLVILLAGSGPADRDGNACTVPGRHDALKQLAFALADRGIASYRYDKLGAGESFYMLSSPDELRFSHYVEDAAACARFFRKDSRFSKIVLLGYTEGALVAAAASLVEKADGVIACAASDEYVGDILRKSIEAAEEPARGEGLAILAALEAGKLVPAVSEFYAESLLRPSNQRYVISWMAYRPDKVFSAVKAPMLFVWGDRDLQVTLERFQALCAFAPAAKTAVIPGMNHVLKSVSPIVNDNLSSFSNPDYPLGVGLADSLSAFVRALR